MDLNNFQLKQFMSYFYSWSMVGFLFLPSCTAFNMSELDEKYMSFFVVVNNTPDSVPFIVLRMNDVKSKAPLDSMIAGPLAPFDSVTLRHNFEFVPTDRMYTNTLYVWKNLNEDPLISKGFDGNSRIGRWHYTIQTDTILPKAINH